MPCLGTSGLAVPQYEIREGEGGCSNQDGGQPPFCRVSPGSSLCPAWYCCISAAIGRKCVSLIAILSVETCQGQPVVALEFFQVDCLAGGLDSLAPSLLGEGLGHVAKHALLDLNLKIEMSCMLIIPRYPHRWWSFDPCNQHGQWEFTYLCVHLAASMAFKHGETGCHDQEAHCRRQGICVTWLHAFLFLR